MYELIAAITDATANGLMAELESMYYSSVTGHSTYKEVCEAQAESLWMVIKDDSTYTNATTYINDFGDRIVSATKAGLNMIAQCEYKG